MNNRIKQIIKDFVPLITLKIYQNRSSNVRFVGNYPTWDEACKASSSYDSDLILNKVKDALLKVKNGEAVYERDSVLFDKIQYSWPLLSGLLWIASQKRNRLSLVDFGGSLGSTYYQNRKFLVHIEMLQWSIIEQKKIVECGKRYFENDQLKFYYDLDDCCKEQNPDAILFSSVIQYFENPYSLLEKVLSFGFDFIIFDRTPFMEEGADRIAIQKVPPEIYQASYPAWFFNKDKFLNYFRKDYELIEEFDALAGQIFIDYRTKARDKGYIFKRLRNR